MLSGTSLTGFPRARRLTDALNGPAARGPDDAERRAVAGGLERALAAVPAPDGRLKLDRFALRRALLGAGDQPAPRPFAWGPRTARRTLGLAALRRCVTGPARAPADAVAELMADVLSGGGEARAGSLRHWLAHCASGERAVAQAEALRWATDLYTAFEWGRLEGVEVGPPDAWWTPATVPLILLQGRAEVRARVAGPPSSPGGSGPADHVVMLSVSAGRPTQYREAELALPALVTWLAGRPAPVRVLGYWPECGRALVVPIDGAVLRRTANAVIAAVAATRRRHHPPTPTAPHPAEGRRPVEGHSAAA